MASNQVIKPSTESSQESTAYFDDSLRVIYQKREVTYRILSICFDVFLGLMLLAFVIVIAKALIFCDSVQEDIICLALIILLGIASIVPLLLLHFQFCLCRAILYDLGVAVDKCDLLVHQTSDDSSL